MNDKFMFSSPQALSVSELVSQIRDRLETTFPDVYVQGEVSGFSKPGSGHYYFTLKDSNTQIRTVMFKMQNRLLRFVPENGMEVLARGRVSCYPPRGSLQMIVDYLEPKGAGALAAAFLQRKKELAAKGYFDKEIKKPLPKLVDTMGIVTSPTGAALYDALRIAFSRKPNLQVIIAPSMVQGDSAPEQIARAMNWLIKDGRSQVILLIRGGGSAEDLWAFNELDVAKAIHDCPIPVVSGVGHEIDFTISDFCADLRAPTPTAAAEMAVPDVSAILQDIGHLKNRVLRAYANRLKENRNDYKNLDHRLLLKGVPTLMPAQRLDELNFRLGREMKALLSSSEKNLTSINGFLHSLGKTRVKETANEFGSIKKRLFSSSPKGQNVERRLQLERVKERLGKSGRRSISQARAGLNKTHALLNALSPLTILNRGYSITRKGDKAIVKSENQVANGEKLEVLLGKGALEVLVKGKRETHDQ